MYHKISRSSDIIKVSSGNKGKTNEETKIVQTKQNKTIQQQPKEKEKKKKKTNQPKLELVLPSFPVIFWSTEPQKKTQWIMSKTLYLKHIFVELYPLTP